MSGEPKTTIWIVLGNGGLGEDQFTEIVAAFRDETLADRDAEGRQYRRDIKGGSDYELHTFYVESVVLQ